jgi:hypothetical protein
MRCLNEAALKIVLDNSVPYSAKGIATAPSQMDSHKEAVGKEPPYYNLHPPAS